MVYGIIGSCQSAVNSEIVKRYVKYQTVTFTFNE